MMAGLLVAALGLALAAWRIRALAARTPGPSRALRAPVASFIVFFFAAVCLAGGAALTWMSVESAAPQIVVFGATAAVAAWGIAALRGKVPREFQRHCEEFRRENPGLDSEAMYRYLVKKRHPEWDTARILRITETCGSLAEFARRLKQEEASPSRLKYQV